MTLIVRYERDISFAPGQAPVRGDAHPSILLNFIKEVTVLLRREQDLAGQTHN